METSRIILFRAKRKDNGKWVEGYPVPTCVNTYKQGYEMIEVNGINYDELDYYSPSYISYEIDPTTLSQFTGMYDKNEKRIFENDIVKTQYGRLCIVKWYSGDSYCGWDLDPINTSDNLRLKLPSEYFLWSKEDNEIVGNVFDNYDVVEEAFNERTRKARMD